MTSAILLLTVTFLMTWHTIFAELITSTFKLQQLQLLEEQLLKRIDAYTQNLFPYEIQKKDMLQLYKSFFQERRIEVETLKTNSENGWHPNDVYHQIKACAIQWPSILRQLPDFVEKFPDVVTGLPNSTEISSTIMAMVRLQLVYGLRAEDMYSGNYLGYMGRPLTPDDPPQIAIEAFKNGYYEESQPWSQMAASKAREEILQRGTTPGLTSRLGQMMGLLGRAYMRTGERPKALEISRTAENIDRNQGDFVELVNELRIPPDSLLYNTPKVRHYQKVLLPLCRRPKDQRVRKLKRIHFCRYHSGVLVPYYRFKEEILALSPFVSIFYDVISDREIEDFKRGAREKLYDARVTNVPGQEQLDLDVRTGKIAWLFDVEFPVANKLSQRVHAITGLDVCQPGCAEPYQVVNYGLGGHYYPHYDVFDVEAVDPDGLVPLGHRLATFLVYLSNVDIGGATVFLGPGISVSPIKGAALFWYNLNPNVTLNTMTFHAGCPVVKGHKWITNKWIWSHGNALTRLCGPHPNSTHLEVEHLLYSRN